MKLSELIAFRNRLEELPVSVAEQAAQDKLDILMHTVTYPHEPSMSQLTQPFMLALAANLKKIHAAFDDFSISVGQLKQQVLDQIEEQEKHWFQESYRVFEAAELCEKTDQILYGRVVTGIKSQATMDAEDTLRARLSIYADWRWPGMIIRPGLEDFIENMVGSDPLYVIDREHALLQPCLDRFPRAYQNRLRPYTTDDWSDKPILGKIPNNQFGVCLACNVLNFRPLEIIRRYLEEIYTKLRPGGVLLMTYNDCDLAHAVMLAEQGFASYTPGYLVRDLAQHVGFKLVHTWSDGGPGVWLELHKPGELISNRGGQALAKTQNVFDYSNDIDYLIRRAYTEDEVAKMQEAKKYNIDISDLDWENMLHAMLQEKEAEEHRIKLRIAQELHEEMAKSVDQRKQEELVKLRQRALQLEAGNPNLIRYGYSAEKLKHLIKQKEEEKK
jgi:SAM-dependent methyltransferase